MLLFAGESSSRVRETENLLYLVCLQKRRNVCTLSCLFSFGRKCPNNQKLFLELQQLLLARSAATSQSVTGLSHRLGDTPVLKGGCAAIQWNNLHRAHEPGEKYGSECRFCKISSHLGDYDSFDKSASLARILLDKSKRRRTRVRKISLSWKHPLQIQFRFR